MTATEANTNSTPRTTSRRKWLACGCGAPLLLLVAVIAWLWLAPSKTPEDAVTEIQSTLKPLPPQFTGDWKAPDGATISMRADGTAAFRNGNEQIKDGRVTVDEPSKTLKIAAASRSQSWTIETPPRDVNGIGEMKLSGRVYRRTGGFDPDGSIAADGVPSNQAMRAMVQQTLLNFNRAVQTRNFKEFHANLATPFREQTTPQDFQNAFKAFFNRNFDIASIQNLQPSFSPPPAIDSEGHLSIAGFYPTRPLRLHFALKYYREDNIWKLNRIDISEKK